MASCNQLTSLPFKGLRFSALTLSDHFNKRATFCKELVLVRQTDRQTRQAALMLTIYLTHTEHFGDAGSN